MPTDAASIALGSKSILQYGLNVEPDYRPSEFHEIVSDYVDRWVEHEIPKLIIVAPPQHGKSLIVSRFLIGYALGRYPDKKFLHTSYAKDPVTELSLDAQAYMRSDEYQMMFPEVRIAKNIDGKKTTNRQDKFRIDGHRGRYNAVGVKGPITSKGANYLVIDDPVKGEEDVTSELQRKKLQKWYRKVWLSRRNAPTSELIMATRWHIDDLTGWVLKNQLADWTVVHFPRKQVYTGTDRPYDTREDGKMLWPERELLPDQWTEGVKQTEIRKHYVAAEELEAKDRKKYDEVYRLSARDTTCLEQGMPIIAEGALYKARAFWKDWDGKREIEINRYHSLDELPDNLICKQSWDFSMGSEKVTASFCCGNVFGMDENTLILLPFEERGQWDLSKMKAGVRRLTARYPNAPRKIVELKASGENVMSELKGEIKGWIPFIPKGSKKDRGLVSAEYINSGNFLIPSSELWPSSVDADGEYVPGVNDWIEEILRFPTEPNDRGDTLSQFVILSKKNARIITGGF